MSLRKRTCFADDTPVPRAVNSSDTDGMIDYCKRFALPASAQPSLREGSGTPKSSVGKVRILLKACDRTSSLRCLGSRSEGLGHVGPIDAMRLARAGGWLGWPEASLGWAGLWLARAGCWLGWA